jgi:hypothetical protein
MERQPLPRRNGERIFSLALDSGEHQSAVTVEDADLGAFSDRLQELLD